MKRRNFLKGLIATPAAASVTRLDAAIPKVEWEPKIYDYGDFGVLKVQIVSSKRHIVEAIASYPESDFINECEGLNVFNTGIYESYPWTEDNKPVEHPFTLAIPVNELTRVQVYVDKILIANDIPKSTGKDYMFKPWLFSGVIGA